ncbi:MAG: hypothetical protein Q9223_005364 [Gallowayella weberi]
MSKGWKSPRWPTLCLIRRTVSLAMKKCKTLTRKRHNALQWNGPADHRRHSPSGSSNGDRLRISQHPHQPKRKSNRAGEADLNTPVARPGALRRPCLHGLGALVNSEEPNRNPKTFDASSTRRQRQSATTRLMAANRAATSGSVELPPSSTSPRPTAVDSLVSPAPTRSSVAKPTVRDVYTEHQLQSAATSQGNLQSDCDRSDIYEGLVKRQLEVRAQLLEDYIELLEIQRQKEKLREMSEN